MTALPATDALTDRIAAELAEPVHPAACAMAAALAAKGGGTVAAVLFYGSVLRTHDLSGVLDFYVLVDSLGAWHGRPVFAALNRMLPPNVEYWELPFDGGTVRAKVAIMAMDQFERAVRPGSLDTTIWARFAQPVRLVHGRDAASTDRATRAVAQAVATAARWAALLGPADGAPRDFWDALFRHTYAAELRVETGARAVSLVDHAADRYAALLTPGWDAAGIGWRDAAGRLSPALTDRSRLAGRRGWALRRLLGKPLNVARLIKAAFTFTGGVDYIAWKIKRHSGVDLALTPWQRRHPVLAAPGVLWRLRKQGAIR